MIKKIVISQSPLTKAQLQQVNQAHSLEEKYGGVSISCDFVVSPNFLKDVVLEKDGDIDERWLQAKLNNLQYHIVTVIISNTEWKKKKLPKKLLGQARVVETRFGRQGISYGRWSNSVGKEHVEKLPSKFKGTSSLALGIWHEDSHIMHRLLNRFDETHYAFYGERAGKRWTETPTPEVSWSKLPFNKLESPKDRTRLQIISLLYKVVGLYDRLINMNKPTLLHPVENYKEMITQTYGVKSAVYTTTGHHIGCDYATPVGTLIKAPYSGEVTVSGYSEVLGYFCHYRYEKDGKIYTDRYLHQQFAPRIGQYSRGTIIGKTGNSGFSTGPHLHLDIWKDDVDLTIINKKNWDKLTVDPNKHYGN